MGDDEIVKIDMRNFSTISKELQKIAKQEIERGFDEPKLFIDELPLNTSLGFVMSGLRIVYAMQPNHTESHNLELRDVVGVGIHKSIETLIDLGMLDAASGLLGSYAPATVEKFSMLSDDVARKNFLSTIFL